MIKRCHKNKYRALPLIKNEHRKADKTNDGLSKVRPLLK